MTVPRKISLGMVGGGQGAFIGAVHRIAARLDNRFDLVAGALSSDPTRAKASAAELGLAAERSYATYTDMAQQESQRPDGIEVAVIVTPNHLHFPVAKAMLEAGIHVICDKPVTATLVEAETLQSLSHNKGLMLAVTYNYSGYPLVRQAKEMVARGDLGTLRLVQVEYAQDWLASNIEAQGQKQALWRTDPALAGAGGSLGDIGSHAFHLAEFISGQQVNAVLADLHSFVPGRQLDDNAHVLLRFDGGAKGALWASQVASGQDNGLRIRLYGDKAGLEWMQEQPNELLFTPLGKPQQCIKRSGSGSTASANAGSRLPVGHPEGFLEGFANLYRDIADFLIAKEKNKALRLQDTLVPDIAQGVRGMRFIERAVASAKAGSSWEKIP